MQEFIASTREQIAELCRMHHVKRLAVFGSAVREDFDPDSSDVDLLVEFETLPVSQYADNFFSLEASLELLFERKVDLITSSSLENPFIIRRVRENQERLYAA